MHVSKYLILAFCASVFVFIGQAMAGEWTDEFEDEDQMAEDWTPLFGTWKFMDGKYRMEAGGVSGASITDLNLGDATSIEINAAYVDGGWENFSIILAYCRLLSTPSTPIKIDVVDTQDEALEGADLVFASIGLWIILPILRSPIQQSLYLLLIMERESGKL